HTPTRRGTRTLTGVSCISAVSEGGTARQNFDPDNFHQDNLIIFPRGLGLHSDHELLIQSQCSLYQRPIAP
ncbi:unnamed protein product, partial [Amoebophrya sp. A120]